MPSRRGFPGVSGFSAMQQRASSLFRRLIGAGLPSLALLTAGLGCPGSAGSPLDELLGAARSNGVMVRVVSQLGVTVNMELQADNRVVALGDCSTVSCDYFVTPCPQTLRPLQTRRFNTAGELIGGVDFTTTEAYRLTRGADFDCGDTIFFDFQNEVPDIYVPGRE
jgi:hypothetical protein